MSPTKVEENGRHFQSHRLGEPIWYQIQIWEIFRKDSLSCRSPNMKKESLERYEKILAEH